MSPYWGKVLLPGSFSIWRQFARTSEYGFPVLKLNLFWDRAWCLLIVQYTLDTFESILQQELLNPSILCSAQLSSGPIRSILPWTTHTFGLTYKQYLSDASETLSIVNSSSPSGAARHRIISLTPLYISSLVAWLNALIMSSSCLDRPTTRFDSSFSTDSVPSIINLCMKPLYIGEGSHLASHGFGNRPGVLL